MAHHSNMADNYNQPWTWKNMPGYKPALILFAAVVFFTVVWLPPTKGMIDLVNKTNPIGYSLPKGCSNIVETVNKKLRPKSFEADQQGKSAKAHEEHEPLLTDKEVAQLAKIMVATLFLAAFLWGTEALPLGATDILVGVVIYLFGILPIEEISKAYMQDAVFFIFGILAVAVGVAKTGLDKRIGLILLSRIKSAKGFAFIFLPLLAMAASFLSEHALVALLLV